MAAAQPASSSQRVTQMTSPFVRTVLMATKKRLMPSSSSKAADEEAVGRAVGQAIGKAKDHHQHEEADQQPQRRGDEVLLLAGDQLEDPDKKERAQRYVEEGRLETDAKGQGCKRQHEDHPGQGHKAPMGIVQDQHQTNHGDRRGQRQQAARQCR